VTLTERDAIRDTKAHQDINNAVYTDAIQLITGNVRNAEPPPLLSADENTQRLGWSMNRSLELCFYVEYFPFIDLSSQG
jgi:hypothetical protein